MVFTHWPREDCFPVSGALRGKCCCLSRFCNILLQNLTPLHSKITRSMNLLSVCRRKLKLSTYLNTVSYNHISFFGNTRSQLVWVLATLGFYLITWRMISRSAGNKIHFRKQPPKPLSLVGVTSFVSLNLCSFAIRPRLPCFHTIK